MNWYYVLNGAQAGPVDEAQIDELVRTQVITPETLVWKDGMANWQPYRTARSAAPPAFPSLATGEAAPAYQGIPAAGGRACAHCGLIFPDTEVVPLAGVYVCAGCKPLALQRMREGTWIAGSRRYGGFWIRGVAFLIDALILGVVAGVLMIPVILGAVGASALDSPELLVGSMIGVVGLVGGIGVFGYQIFFLVKYGATPGKLLLGLKVIRSDGGPINAWRAVGRMFAQSLSQMILYIGYIMAGFDNEKRALHDHICDTRVVYKS